MRIGLLGHGTVGSGVSGIIKMNRLFEVAVAKILVKDESDVKNETMTVHFEDILNDESIDTVMECMGGLEPAHTYCIQSLEAGKNVITSNKAMVASYYNELIDTAKRKGVKFYFEASVGGGIPWIHNLIKTKSVDSILGFKGILNGTTNYILDKMFTEGKDFEEVLLEAQALGYAEKDPSSDIDGIDVQYKSVLSANVAWSTSIKLEDVCTLGIRNITFKDVEYCKENGYVCKLVGQGYKKEWEDVHKDEEVDVFVQPEFVKDIFASIGSNYNFVSLQCKTLGNSSFMGQGAGKYPTAHAMLQDAYSIVEKEILPIYHTHACAVKNTRLSSYYVRTAQKEIFKNIIEKEIDEESFITKKIEVKQMKQFIEECKDEKIFVAGVGND